MKVLVNKVSKTKIKFNLKKKTNPEVSEAISLALKNKGWLAIAKRISSSRRMYSKVNLSEIEAQTSAGDTVVVIGKVLGNGDVTKKVRICSFGFSKSALDKLRKTKSEPVSIAEEIKKNPKAEGIKVIN